MHFMTDWLHGFYGQKLLILGEFLTTCITIYKCVVVIEFNSSKLISTEGANWISQNGKQRPESAKDPV